MDEETYPPLPSLGQPVTLMLRQDTIVRVGVCLIIHRWNNTTRLFVNKDGEYGHPEILVIQRHGSHGAGTWGVPGGWLEFGELAMHAAIREANEEVGATVDRYTVQHTGFTEDFFPEEKKHCLTLWYRAALATDSPVPQIAEPNKLVDMRWVNVGRYDKELPQPLFTPLRNYVSKGLRLG